MDCRTRSRFCSGGGSGAMGAVKSRLQRGKSLLGEFSEPEKARQRGAPHIKTGRMNEASVKASVDRPLITSHNRRAGVRPIRPATDHCPVFRTARGLALRSQWQICITDADNDTPRTL